MRLYRVLFLLFQEIVKKFEVRLGNTPGVNVTELQWNPGLANMLGAVLSDGSAVCVEFKGPSFSINSLPPNVMATYVTFILSISFFLKSLKY